MVMVSATPANRATPPAVTTAVEIRRVLLVRDMYAALLLRVPWAEDLLLAELDRRRDELRRMGRLSKVLGTIGACSGYGLRPYYLRRSA